MSPRASICPRRLRPDQAAIDAHRTARGIHEGSVAGERELSRATQRLRGNTFEDRNWSSFDFEVDRVEHHREERTGTAVDQVSAGRVTSVSASADENLFLAGLQGEHFDARIVVRRFVPACRGEDDRFAARQYLGEAERPFSSDLYRPRSVGFPCLPQQKHPQGLESLPPKQWCHWRSSCCRNRRTENTA